MIYRTIQFVNQPKAKKQEKEKRKKTWKLFNFDLSFSADKA